MQIGKKTKNFVWQKWSSYKKIKIFAMPRGKVRHLSAFLKVVCEFFCIYTATGGRQRLKTEYLFIFSAQTANDCTLAPLVIK